MDFTEREQQKKRHLIRVILAEAGMVLAVILIVVVTLMITMGFFINSEGRLEQTGLVQIHSVPTGASVTIDGETIFSRTNLSRSLAAGEHHLKLSRDGYDTWERTITMYSGLLLRLYYPRLFLEHRTPETMLTFDHQFEFYSVSSERNFILYAATNGYLDSIAVSQVPEFEVRLQEHMENRYPQVLEAIRGTGKLEPETEQSLKQALSELVAQFAPQV